MICPHCGFNNIPGSEECAQCLQDLTHLDRPAPQDHIERCLMEEAVEVLQPTRPVTLWPSASLRQAIQTMVAHNVGALLIVDEDGHLAGILTERDLLMRVVGLHERFEDLPVSMFMTCEPETISLRDKLVFALHKMDCGDYRHLPVVDTERRAVGVISVRDMLRYLAALCKNHE